MIEVTRPFLPPKEEYDRLLSQIWESNWLTNNGPFVRQLEEELKTYFSLNHLRYVSNGTIALQLAIRALELKGEIITTPFSYVASTSSIIWEHCKPVYADIDPETWNLNPENIEPLITPKTTGILATHVFGNPCDIAQIEAIAKKHNLKIIYDAAHCFGSEYQNQSVLSFGDLSTISFHATKVFHTVEGGAVIAPNANMLDKIAKLMNFGHSGINDFVELGINAKNGELNAAMGVCNLKYCNEILEKRKSDFEQYFAKLNDTSLVFQTIRQDCKTNYSYVPVLFSDKAQRDLVYDNLLASQVHARKYFYPALSSLPYVDAETPPLAKKVADGILCLPTYFTLKKVEIDTICQIVKDTIA